MSLHGGAPLSLPTDERRPASTDASTGSFLQDAENGNFGLQLVDKLADRWGLSLNVKTAVWLEVDNPQS
jgi:hypothetical protein